ncbi:MAG TPA: HEAT repeat domain-containing protein [Sedimentisphaerales bacterium]|nr:HEAT repeat domain-containing protein [Sedimentisphaerales bacterium]
MFASGVQIRRSVVALACLVVLASGAASARISVGIGFGTTFSHHHHYPGYGWYVGPHYWYDPWWDPYPMAVVPPPVVYERRVIVKEHRPTQPAPPRVEKVEPLSEKQQQRRSEALKVLRIGDELARLQAVADLEPFAGDSHVRTTLAKSLSNDRDPVVRKAVAELFSRLRDPKTVAALKQAYAEDEDRDVRQAAYRAIAMMEGYKGL